MALICRLEEWARRPELPHGSSAWVKAHADAHDCIMVRIKRSYRIQVCDARSAPRASFPSDYQSDMQCVPSDAPASKSPISLVILPLRAQASKPGGPDFRSPALRLASPQGTRRGSEWQAFEAQLALA